MTRHPLEIPRDELAQELNSFVAKRSVEELVIHVRRSTLHHARLGANELSSCGTEHSLMARVTVFHEGRSATASTSSLAPEDLIATTQRAAEIAAASPPNPEYMPPPTPWENPQQGTRDPETAEGSTLLPRLAKALLAAREHNVLLSGFLQASHDEDVVCTSQGAALAGHAPSCHTLAYEESSASLSVTARTPSGLGSGKARWSGDRLSELDCAAVAERAIKIARSSENRIALAPDHYPTIFAPAAAADLLGLLVSKMQRRPADEGRSAFSRAHGGNALGDLCLSSNLTLESDPGAVDFPCRPFTLLGEPIGKTDWVTQGTITSLQTDRFWANKSGASFVAAPLNLMVPGTNQSLDEIIASTERALLVHHLWYIRMVDEQSLTVTGLTRDGVFLVENGQITSAVNNLRFNDSPLRIFTGALLLGKSIRTESNEIEDLKMRCPPVRVPSVRYTATSDAV
jgi:predicted Zn-dependent protease